MVDQIADDVGLTADERAALLPSGRQRVIHNRIHWAKFYLTKAGLIEALGKGASLPPRKGCACWRRVLSGSIPTA
ncbi:winged helix-turn-helix domain-containing protein [Tistrella bauzanensis]